MEVLLFMLGGIAAGFVFKKRRSLIITADRLAGWSVYLLLFLLGLSIGGNRNIICNSAAIGVRSILLSLSGIAGSVFLSFILYKIVLRKSKNQ